MVPGMLLMNVVWKNWEASWQGLGIAFMGTELFANSSSIVGLLKPKNGLLHMIINVKQSHFKLNQWGCWAGVWDPPSLNSDSETRMEGFTLFLLFIK